MRLPVLAVQEIDVIESVNLIEVGNIVSSRPRLVPTGVDEIERHGLKRVIEPRADFI
jgi:hypothetical protein